MLFPSLSGLEGDGTPPERPCIGRKAVRAPSCHPTLPISRISSEQVVCAVATGRFLSGIPNVVSIRNKPENCLKMQNLYR